MIKIGIRLTIWLLSAILLVGLIGVVGLTLLPLAVLGGVAYLLVGALAL